MIVHTRHGEQPLDLDPAMPGFLDLAVDDAVILSLGALKNMQGAALYLTPGAAASQPPKPTVGAAETPQPLNGERACRWCHQSWAVARLDTHEALCRKRPP